jgi:AcrR family transcriptional regulator
MATERITAKRAALRLRIIDVALKAFAAQGFENTKTADIADQLQMTGPALYHYFTTKNELLFACLSQIMDQLLASATSATSASTGTAGPRERLASVVRTQVAIELKYGSTAPLINAHLYGPKYLTQMVEEGNQALLQQKQRALVYIYRNLIAEGIDAGDFVPGDIKIAAFNVLAIIQYSGVWYRPKKGRKSLDVIEAQVGAVMNLLGAAEEKPRLLRTRTKPKTTGEAS